MYKVKYKDREYSSMTLACDLLGVSVATVSQYVKRGMSIEHAIEQILKNKNAITVQITWEIHLSL